MMPFGSGHSHRPGSPRRSSNGHDKGNRRSPPRDPRRFRLIQPKVEVDTPLSERTLFTSEQHLQVLELARMPRKRQEKNLTKAPPLIRPSNSLPLNAQTRPDSSVAFPKRSNLKITATNRTWPTEAAESSSSAARSARRVRFADPISSSENQPREPWANGKGSDQVQVQHSSHTDPKVVEISRQCLTPARRNVDHSSAPTNQTPSVTKSSIPTVAQWKTNLESHIIRIPRDPLGMGYVDEGLSLAEHNISFKRPRVLIKSKDELDVELDAYMEKVRQIKKARLNAVPVIANISEVNFQPNGNPVKFRVAGFMEQDRDGKLAQRQLCTEMESLTMDDDEWD